MLRTPFFLSGEAAQKEGRAQHVGFEAPFFRAGRLRKRKTADARKKHPESSLASILTALAT
jgi:hypothetical protein